jgi:hypothetical protein
MKRSYLFGAALLSSVMLLQGCNHDDDDPELRTFQVSITNVTANQPMSPLAVVPHGVDYQGLMVGCRGWRGRLAAV